MKCAIFGFGYWAPNVVRALGRLVGYPNLLIVDSSPQRQAAAATACPGARISGSPEEAFADPSYECLFVCTPSATHLSLARRALESGRHVFVEKPFTTNLADARTLLHLAREKKRIAFPGHVHLHTPLFDFLRRTLQEGTLGTPRFARSEKASLGPRVREDVNIVWDYLIHDVYTFHDLLGGPPKRVWAQGAAYLRPGIEDVVFAVLEYPGPFLIELYSSWYAPEKTRSLLLVGARGMLEYREGSPQPLRLFQRGYRPYAGVDRHGNQNLELFDEGCRAITLEQQEEPLVREVRTFLDAARSGTGGAVWERHILEVASTLETIDTSIRQGGIPLPVPGVA